MLDLSADWVRTLREILDFGVPVSPRGQPTLELPQRTSVVNMRRPVLTVPDRRLNYRFMAAEAYWILTGDDRVDGIAPWNPNIAQFSDDGRVFFGAYGPKVVGQLGYVVKKLIADRDTRQAGLTIWRENPPETKDVPCTVAMFFSVRESVLNVHVFMRSNDVWLGFPYDVFNFSMIGHYVCAMLNDGGTRVVPGALFLTAASSHLYEAHFDAAKSILASHTKRPMQPATPTKLFNDPAELMRTLKMLRDTKPGDRLRWWEV